MSDDILGMTVRKLETLPVETLGAVYDLLEKLSDPEWVEATKWFLRKQDPWEDATPITDLLRKLGIADVCAQEPFKAADFFREDGQPDGIRFRLGTCIKVNFLRKVETAVPAAALNVYRFAQSSLNVPIVVALGGSDAAKTSLTYVAQLIRAQPQGQEGVLLTNGHSNFFYIEDDNGELSAVRCVWSSSECVWIVDADPVTALISSSRGCRIFSPAALVS